MTRSRRRCGAARALARWPIFALTLSTLVGGAGMAAAAAPVLPTGGQVQTGSAVIGAPSGSTLTISQSSNRAIIDWSNFSIGSGASVQFNNGAGATLNRVAGGSISTIDGLLSGTGSVYLINPSGVIIGKSGVVKVGGTFAASTLDVANSQFMGGGDLTFLGSSNAAVINYGKIGALGGDVALIASRVENDGEIDAARGDVGLASGYQVVLRDQLLDGGKFSVLIGGPNTSATNTGVIRAAEAELRANGGNVYALAGDTSSIIKATGVAAKDGKVFLVAEGGSTTAHGEIDATRSDGAGGQVETSGSTVDFNGLTVRAANWLVDPYDLTVDAAAAATINTNLATTSVTLQTTASSASGPGVVNPSGVGDINITAPISWSSANTFTLDAYRGINITAPITASGAGKVVLKTNNGGTGGDYGFGSAAWLQFTGPEGSGQALTINGQAYTLLYSMAELSTINTTNLAGDFAVAAPLNAAGTTYDHALIGAASGPFAGTSTGSFSGVFEGLGNTISNLTINEAVLADGVNGYVGLFGYSTGTVRDVGLVGGSVTSNVSTLGDFYVGGLVGWNAGAIRNAYATDAISGNFQVFQAQGDVAFLGGLVGYNSSGTIGNAYATGAVGSINDANNRAAYIGGLVGEDMQGNVSRAFATGAVTGDGGSFNVGGLIGFENGGSVSQSYASGAVRGNSSVGGLVGLAKTTTIFQSYATGAVSGYVNSTFMGGLVGQLLSGTITQSYAIGSVSGSQFVGGLVGTDLFGSAISQSYATGLVNNGVSGSNIGGLMGGNSATAVTSSYWDTQTTGQAGSAGGGVGLTTAQFFAAANFTGFTFGTTPGGSGWVIVDADGTLNNAGSAAGATRPMLLSEYSTTVTNAHQLQLMALNLGATYTLGANIDASATNGSLNPSDVWPSAGFLPIGGQGASGPNFFEGVLDGQGHTISNLFISRPSSAYVGLFGVIDQNAIVRNVGIVGGSTSGANSGGEVGGLAGENRGAILDSFDTGSVTGGTLSAEVGGLVGNNAGGSISQSYAAGSVDGSQSSAYVGGLVGQNNGPISQSYASGLVTGSPDRATGGLVGFTGAISPGSSKSAITQSYATGNVDGSGSGNAGIGGLVGNNNDGGLISQSYATGAVNSGGLNQVGGLVGFNGIAEITQSYATGAVNSEGGSYVGGLIGYNYAGTITQTYATGAVSGGGGSNVGGLVGGEITSSVLTSYWDTTTSGQLTSAGGAGLTTAQFFTASNLAGFTFGTTPGASGWVIVDYDGSLNNAGGPVGGSTRPILLSEYSTTIVNDHQLQLMALNDTANYVLAANIDASDTNGAVNPSGVWSSTGFSPIGNQYSPRANYFTGIFDGKKHTISNLYSNQPNSGYEGLFGEVYIGGIVRNVGLLGGSIGGGGEGDVGGLVGLNYGTISNSFDTGSVSGDTFVAEIGGLVGDNQQGLITQSYATGAVDGSKSHAYTGGLVGANTGTITGSYATGLVTAAPSMAAGGLVGFNNGPINQSFATGEVDASGFDNDGLGGLVGNDNSNGPISQSFATGAVKGAGGFSFGGLIGYNGTGTITQTYATGDVNSGGGSDVGGLVGTAYGGTVTQSYATGAVISGGGSNVGGLIGDQSSAATIGASYWDTQTTGQSASAGGVGLTTAQFFTAANMPGFTFGTTPGASGWVIVDLDGTLNNAGSGAGGTRPMLLTEYSTTIANAHQLQLMTLNRAASYVLAGDFDASGTNAAVHPSDMWTSAGFLPIGDQFIPFSGVLDGANHTISGLTINLPTTSDVGMIAESTGTVRNIGLVGGSVAGHDYVGPLVGFNIGRILNAYATGTVNGDTAGGLVGRNDGTIGGAHASGALTATFDAGGLGGLVGFNDWVGSITSSYATGAIINTYGDSGGLVGTNSGMISNSFATGQVNGDIARSQNLGGLVGTNDFKATITNAYAMGAVIGEENVGGLVGYNAGNIINAFATGAVKATFSGAGGLVGSFTGGSIAASYWDAQTTGQTTSAGSANSFGLTTSGLQGVLPAGWSSSVWATGAGLYPYLSSFFPNGVQAISGTVEDALNHPVAGAQVGVYIDGYLLTGGMASSGANGHFYEIVPAGTLPANGLKLGVSGYGGISYTDALGLSGSLLTGLNVVSGVIASTTQDTTYSALQSDLATAFGPANYAAMVAALPYDNIHVNAAGSFTIDQPIQPGVGFFSVLVQSGGDITVAAPISLIAAQSLTLNAHQNIAVNANLTSGNGGTISIRADDVGLGVGTVTFGSGALLSATGGSSIFYDPASNPAGSPVNPTSYTNPTDYSIDVAPGGGAVTAYMLVNRLIDLQNMQNNLTGDYALGTSFDASGSPLLNGGAGFVPIGSTSPFTGVFEGENQVINNLVINRPSATGVGLFGTVGAGGKVLDVVVSGSVTGQTWTGGLVGVNHGLVSFATSAATVNGTNGVGGLVGYNDGLINFSGAAGGSITGSNYVGGLIGWNDVGGFVGLDYSAGATVTATTYEGGFVGYNLGSISTSNTTDKVVSTGSAFATGGFVGSNAATGVLLGDSATGAVSGGVTWTGGLAGVNLGAINGGSSATGSVGGVNGVGGLVGDNLGSIGLTGASTKASGAVSGTNFVGGLVGFNSGAGSINGAVASGTATGTGTWTGGLVGGNFGVISNSSASGAVSGATGAGGLAAYNIGSITSSSAGTGSVSGSLFVGGLVGQNDIFGSLTSDSVSGATASGGAEVGGLVGYNQGSISTSTSSDAVTGTGSAFAIGGLVGWNSAGGTISGDSASGAVSGGLTWTGGLVGVNQGSISSASFASGTVSGTTGVGGLAGINTGSITGSNAHTGSVTGTTYVGGLVGWNDAGATMSGDGSSAATVHAVSFEGGLVGYNLGSVSTSTSSDTVVATGSAYATGGLVGSNGASGTISADSASGAVSGGVTWTGGLTGVNLGAISGNSSATGSVGGSGGVGGLTGYNNGSIAASSTATGTVTGANFVGGLVGENDTGGTIGGSTAAETVNGSGSWTGGLAGVNYGAINAGSSATGAVNGTNGAGGLVGYNNGSISIAFETGAVSGVGADTGGLVGDNGASGVIANTYALGSVSGSSHVGGLIGVNSGSAGTSYADGAVSGIATTGGVVGTNASGATIQNVYWDVSTTGQPAASGSNAGTLTNVLGVGGSTGRDPHAQASYAGFDFTNIWTINPGTSRPYLKGVPSSTPPP